MARCPICREIIPVGCNGYVEDSDCFTWSGSGTDADPWKLNPRFSADPDQLAECLSGGLFADSPASITNPSAAYAYRTTNQSIPNNTMTTITLGSELYDTDTMHSTSSNTGRLTFTTTGYYIVTANITMDNNITGDRVVQILKNATDVLAYESKDAGGADLLSCHSITIQDSFTATDYVEVQAQQTSGGALLVLSESYSPIWTATRVA